MATLRLPYPSKNGLRNLSRQSAEEGDRRARFWLQQEFDMVSFRNEFVKVSTLLMLAVLVMPALQLSAKPTSQPRTVLSADADWKFFLGDPAGAESPTFNDDSWRTVTVPHDWSIEGLPNQKNPTGSGEGYFPAGIGWYRKAFTAPANWKGKQVSLEFDGVSLDATVYLNGQKIGNHPYAYTSFRFDITSHLNFSARNVVGGAG